MAVKTYDIALAETQDGEVVMHTATCPVVRRQAEAGNPVATLLGCESLPLDIPRHDCLPDV